MYLNLCICLLQVTNKKLTFPKMFVSKNRDVDPGGGKGGTRPPNIYIIEELVNEFAMKNDARRNVFHTEAN